MSFLQRLRMNNVFGGDMFTPIQGNDPYREIINDFQNYQSQPMMNRTTPMSRPTVNRGSIATPDEGLRFGGVFDSGPNPGADILARSKAHAEDLYDSYSKPALQAGNVLAAAGIKPNEQFPGERDAFDIDRQIKENNLEISKRRIADTEKRTSIADYKAKNPNHRYFPIKGGNIMAIDPQTNEAVDTGIATNTLSDKDLAELKDKLADDKPATPTKPLLPTQDKVQLFNRAKELADRNPAYRDYIKLDNGNFDIVAPGKALFGRMDTGPSQDVYNAIIKGIYGDQNNAPTNNAAPVVNQTTNNPAPTDKIKVIRKSDGKPGTISAGAFNPAKYDKVQ